MSPCISDLYLRSQTDARLLSLTRDGHGRAFAVLAERYRAELLGQARRLSGSANAEDLLQQTMLSAFAALDRGADVGHVRGWLHAILRNAAIRARGPVQAPLELALQTGETPDALLEARADARLVLSALDELPTRQREALVGSSVQGLSRAELATTLGVTEGAVRQLVHRARSTVRAAITSLTPYPVVRWLSGAGGSASAGPPELALATGAAGAGGVVAKLGMVAAAGAIAASGLAAAGHHGTRPDARADRADRVSQRRAAADANVARTGGGPGAPEVAGEFVTVATRPTRRAAAHRRPGYHSGLGPLGPRTAGGGWPGSAGRVRADAGSRSAGGTSGSSRDGGSRGGSGNGISRPSGGGDGSRGAGPGSGSLAGAGTGAGGSTSSDSGDHSSPGAGGSGSDGGGTATTAAPIVSTTAVTAASDGGGSGGGGSSGGGSGAGADGGQTGGTSTTSTGRVTFCRRSALLLQPTPD